LAIGIIITIMAQMFLNNAPAIGKRKQ